MTNSKFKNKLASGKSVLGTWCEIPSPEFINVLAQSGLDFVIIDMEHGSMSFETASRMIMAAQVEGTAAFIRVAKNDESEILRALDIAPDGVIVPHINSVEDRIKAVTNVKFPPIGTRGLNPYTRSGKYHNSKSYTIEQNKNTKLGLIIEGISGIDSLDKIIDKYSDIVYIGTYDLSAALNIPGDVGNKIILSKLEKCVSIINSRHKLAGTMFHDPKELKVFKNMGVKFLCYKADTGIVYDEIQAIINK